MRIEIGQTGEVYVVLGLAPATRTVEVAGGEVLLDYDKHGRLIGVEILSAGHLVHQRQHASIEYDH